MEGQIWDGGSDLGWQDGIWDYGLGLGLWLRFGMMDPVWDDRIEFGMAGSGLG